jgi:tetratricopeptide (TPR) repeat protein
MTTKMPQTLEEKIEISNELKKQGNEFLKLGEYKKACHTYKKVFLYINGINSSIGDIFSGNQNGPKSTKEKSANEIEIETIRLSINLNLSLCYIKMKNYQRAMEHVQAALKIEPENMKGVFRRGQCYLNLNGLTKI